MIIIRNNHVSEISCSTARGRATSLETVSRKCRTDHRKPSKLTIMHFHQEFGNTGTVEFNDADENMNGREQKFS